MCLARLHSEEYVQTLPSFLKFANLHSEHVQTLPRFPKLANLHSSNSSVFAQRSETMLFLEQGSLPASRAAGCRRGSRQQKQPCREEECRQQQQQQQAQAVACFLVGGQRAEQQKGCRSQREKRLGQRRRRYHHGQRLSGPHASPQESQEEQALGLRTGGPGSGMGRRRGGRAAPGAAAGHAGFCQLQRLLRDGGC